MLVLVLDYAMCITWATATIGLRSIIGEFYMHTNVR